MQQAVKMREISFRFTRLLTAFYFSIYFYQLFPYADVLYGGAMANFHSHPNWYIPNVFAWYAHTAYFCQAAIAAGLLFSILLAFEHSARIAAFLLWILLSQMSMRNPIATELQISFLGWLLLLFVLRPRSQMEHKIAIIGAWAASGLAYSLSGLNKLRMPFWTDGSAVHWLRDLQIFFNVPTSGFLVQLPGSNTWMLIITWSTLILELCFAPLALFRRTRFLVWAGMLLMHVTVVFSSGIAQLSTGLLIFHFFLIEPVWLTQLEKWCASRASWLSRQRLFS